MQPRELPPDSPQSDQIPPAGSAPDNEGLLQPHRAPRSSPHLSRAGSSKSFRSGNSQSGDVPRVPSMSGSQKSKAWFRVGEGSGNSRASQSPRTPATVCMHALPSISNEIPPRGAAFNIPSMNESHHLWTASGATGSTSGGATSFPAGSSRAQSPGTKTLSTTGSATIRHDFHNQQVWPKARLASLSDIHLAYSRDPSSKGDWQAENVTDETSLSALDRSSQLDAREERHVAPQQSMSGLASGSTQPGTTPPRPRSTPTSTSSKSLSLLPQESKGAEDVAPPFEFSSDRRSSSNKARGEASVTLTRRLERSRSVECARQEEPRRHPEGSQDRGDEMSMRGRRKGNAYGYAHRVLSGADSQSERLPSSQQVWQIFNVPSSARSSHWVNAQSSVRSSRPSERPPHSSTEGPGPPNVAYSRYQRGRFQERSSCASHSSNQGPSPPVSSLWGMSEESAGVCPTRIILSATALTPEEVERLLQDDQVEVGECTSFSYANRALKDMVNRRKPFDLRHLIIDIREVDGGSSEGIVIPEAFNQQLRTLEVLTIRPKLPDAIWALVALTRLSLRSSHNVTALPPALTCLSALRSLEVSHCATLSDLSEFMPRLFKLREITLDALPALRRLPLNFCALTALKCATVTACPALTTLPPLIASLRAPLDLDLDGCTGPDSLLLPGNCHIWGEPSRLTQLTLASSAGLAALPSHLATFPHLRFLEVCACEDLVHFPSFVSQLTGLTTLALLRCVQLEDFPHPVLQLTGLRDLCIAGSYAMVRLPRALGLLTALECLDLSDCRALEELPRSLSRLDRLTRLRLTDCRALHTLPRAIAALQDLRVLTLTGCADLRSLPEEFARLPSTCKVHTRHSGLPFRVHTVGALLERARRVPLASLATLSAAAAGFLQAAVVVAALLATAAALSYARPPSGALFPVDDCVGSVCEPAVTWRPNWLRTFYVANQLTFVVALSVVMAVFAGALPRADGGGDDVRAGRLWVMLTTLTALLLVAVLCAMLAYLAAGMSVYPARHIQDVQGPAVLLLLSFWCAVSYCTSQLMRLCPGFHQCVLPFLLSTWPLSSIAALFDTSELPSAGCFQFRSDDEKESRGGSVPGDKSPTVGLGSTGSLTIAGDSPRSVESKPPAASHSDQRGLEISEPPLAPVNVLTLQLMQMTKRSFDEQAALSSRLAMSQAALSRQLHERQAVQAEHQLSVMKDLLAELKIMNQSRSGKTADDTAK